MSLISWPNGEFNLISSSYFDELIRGLRPQKGQRWDCTIYRNPRFFIKFKPSFPDIYPWTSKEWSSKRLKITVDPVAELQSDFRALMLDEATSDIEVLCNGGSFKCHRSILAARSSYFKSAFNFAADGAANKTIDLSNIQSDLMKIIILYLYTGLLKVPECREPSEEVDLLIRLSEAVDFLVLSTLKDLVHAKIADIFKQPHLKITDLTQSAIEVLVEYLHNLHPCAQHSFMIWLFDHLDSNTYDEMYFSDEFTRQLIDFGKSLHLKDPLFIRRLHTISEFPVSSINLEGDDVPGSIAHGPDFSRFDAMVESVQDLYDVNMLQKVCLQWVYRSGQRVRVRNGHVLSFVQHLLDTYQYDVTKQDCHGNTGLHCAVSRCSVPLVRLLATVDPCTNIYNHMSHTPWDMATDTTDATRFAYKFKQNDIQQITEMLSKPDCSIPHWPLEDEYFEEMKEFYMNFDKMQFDFDPNDHPDFQQELRHCMFTGMDIQEQNIVKINKKNLDDPIEKKRIWRSFQNDLRNRAGCHTSIGERLSYNNGEFIMRDSRRN